MLEAIKDARHSKVENKSRELERERRGEVLKRTLRRRNQGPPPHLLATMTPKERAEDKAVRSVSEVGYVRMLKVRKGFLLRDDRKWREEEGREEDKERLDEMAKAVRRESAERRLRADEMALPP